MAQWVRLCGVSEAPSVGRVVEAEVDGVGICLANVNGELSALDNWCPHRRGPLGHCSRCGHEFRVERTEKPVGARKAVLEEAASDPMTNYDRTLAYFRSHR